VKLRRSSNNFASYYFPQKIIFPTLQRNIQFRFLLTPIQCVCTIRVISCKNGALSRTGGELFHRVRTGPFAGHAAKTVAEVSESRRWRFNAEWRHYKPISRWASPGSDLRANVRPSPPLFIWIHKTLTALLVSPPCLRLAPVGISLASILLASFRDALFLKRSV